MARTENEVSTLPTIENKGESRSTRQLPDRGPGKFSLRPVPRDSLSFYGLKMFPTETDKQATDERMSDLHSRESNTTNTLSSPVGDWTGL